MKLSEEPEIVTWPATHYAYIEKIGPFQETAAKAWEELNKIASAAFSDAEINAKFSLYKIEPNKMTYRAGAGLASIPAKLPQELKYEEFKGGKYSRFVLTGPYSDLPAASRRVFEIVNEKNIKRRDDFCIENYVNDPKKTPEDQLITEILIPTL